MQIETAIQSRLTGYAPLTARVPAARIRTDGEHVDIAPPYIVHGMSNERVTTMYGGRLGLRIAEYDATICARDIDEAYEISDLVVEAATAAASDGVQVIPQTRTRQYDVDARLWVAMVRFSVAYLP